MLTGAHGPLNWNVRYFPGTYQILARCVHKSRGGVRREVESTVDRADLRIGADRRRDSPQSGRRGRGDGEEGGRLLRGNRSAVSLVILVQEIQRVSIAELLLASEVLYARYPSSSDVLEWPNCWNGGMAWAWLRRLSSSLWLASLLSSSTTSCN